MNSTKKLNELVIIKKGIVLIKDVVEVGIPKQFLSNFVKDGKFVRIAHGVYSLQDAFNDEIYIIQARSSRVIFSHDTALFLHDLTDRDPTELVVTLPSGYNATSLKESGIKVYFIKKELYELGIEESKTVYGRQIIIYNKERTICDIVRSRNNIDVSILNEGLKRYVASKNKNIPLLIRYSKEFKVENIIRKYLEVLL